MYRPSPLQQEFHRAHLLGVREVLFGGAAGPGKTEALIWDAVDIILSEHERWRKNKNFKSKARILHLRRTFPQLESNIDRIESMLVTIHGGDRKAVKYDGDSHTFTCPSGLKYQVGHMKDLDSWKNYHGQEYVAVYFDELTQFEEVQYKNVISRVRAVDPELAKWLRVRAATNPEPGWVRDYFVDPAPEGRKILETVVTLADGSTETYSRVYIPAKLHDHPDAEFKRRYETDIRTTQPHHIAEAWINGNWYLVVGSYFADSWIPDVHVIKPFRIPQTWPRFRGMDWGFKNAAPVYWVAIAPNDQLIFYRERTFKEQTYVQVAAEIKKTELEMGLWDRRANRSMISGVLDTQAWEERGNTGPTIALGMMNMGIPWKKATKGRRMAAQEITRRLRHRNSDGTPGMVFFNTCKEAIRTVPTLKVDPTDPEVPQKGGEDHWYDGISYCVMARYTYRSLPPPVEFDEEDEDMSAIAATVSGGRVLLQ